MKVKMNVKKQYKIIFTVLLVVCIILILFSKIQCRQHCHQKVTACSEDGETVEVEFDIYLRRHLWGTAEMSGKLTVGESEYLSVRDLYPPGTYEGDSYVFRIAADYALDGAKDTVILDLYEGKLDTFRILLVKSGELNAYYGSLQTDS